MNLILTNTQKYFLLFIVLLGIPLSGLSIDIYVPSLPTITHFYAIDKSLTQLTITFYMLGFGVMQLFSGIISDCFGRKKPFISAMLIYICAVFATAFAQNIHQLLFLRLIQGAAVGCFSVCLRAVVSDLFSGKEFYKMVNYMTITWAIGPIVAPAIGSYLQNIFNWQASFYFLGIYSLICLLLNLTFMPETIAHKKQFRFVEIKNTYYELLSHNEYMICLLSLGLSFSVTILFSITSPFYIQTVLHYSTIQYGTISLLMGLALFLGNITNRLLINTDMSRRIKTCLMLIFVDLMITLILTIISPYNIYVTVISTAIMFYLSGIIFPNYFAKAIATFPKLAGTANALMGAFMILIGSLSSALATLLKTSSQLPLILVYLVLVLMTYALFQIGIKIQKQKNSLHVSGEEMSFGNSQCVNK